MHYQKCEHRCNLAKKKTPKTLKNSAYSILPRYHNKLTKENILTFQSKLHLHY